MRIQFNSMFLLFIVDQIFDFSRVVSSFEEAEWQPVLYDYYHIDLGELGANQDQRASVGPPSSSSLNTPFSSVKIPTPEDAIINIINDLGIKLLATHNERNENNIAISPYGAFSVLAALTEGLQGDSAHEILHAVRIPYDKQMIRVGLRDIHRHLKSYFIPEEGFLSGLTLNLHNVSLKNEYENVLKFYGFDYDSFNNARLPGDDSATTKKPGEMITTLETGIGLSADTTMPSTAKELEDSSTTTTAMPKTTTTPITTTTPRTTTTTAAVTTTESSKEETTIIIKTEFPEVTTTTTPPRTDLTNPEKNTALETTTTSTTLLPELESSQPQPPPSDTTIIETLEASGASEEKTGDRYSTTVAKDSGNAQITSVTSTSNARSENGITTTKYLQTTSNVFSTSSVGSETATSNFNTVTQKLSTDDSPAMSTIIIGISEENTEKTVVGSTKMIDSENTVRTTRDISFSTITDVDDGSNTTVESSNQITDEDTTATVVINSETVNNDATTSTISSLYEISTLDSTIPLAFTTAKEEEEEEEENKVKESTTIADFDINYNNYDANNNLATSYEEEREDNEEISSENPLMLSTTMPKEEKPKNLFNVKRKVRSVVDYVIARIYEDRPRFLSPPPPPPRHHYLPEDSLSFAVYGKYREPGVNFMKYDTVLPYFFLPNLNAQALSFPLDSTKYYLLLLLPVRENGIDQLICDLRLYGNLRYIIGNLRLTHVVATIPSFMLKGYVTLTPTLQKLGIRRIFEPRQADFSPMANNNSDIYVTNIEQAVTVTIRNYLDPSATRYKNFQQYPAVTFKADHPFLYFVVDSELHVALMVGKVINPLNSRIS